MLTARFNQLNGAEMEKLGPWTVDGSLTVSKEYILEGSGKVIANYYALMKVPEEPWLNEDFEDYNKREVVSRLPIAEFLPRTGRITKDAYKQAITQFTERCPDKIKYRIEQRKNPAGYKQVLDGYLPELHLVQAVREATEETKTTSTALLGKLLGVVVRRIAQFNPAFQQLRDAVDRIKKVIEGETPGEKMTEIRELEDSIQKALSIWDVKVNISVHTPDVDRLFQLGTNVVLDDGLPTGVEGKGHGLQRSLIFALMRVWAAESRRHIGVEAGVLRERSNVFAFEEPELFLHPQVCRATYEALKEISATDQTLLCTHSSHFVNIEDYRNLSLIRKVSQIDGTKAVRVTTDLFEGDEERKQRFNMIRFFNPDRNEVFFARKVALVEGATEKAVIPVIARRSGIFDHSVSLIDCAGKFNLTLYTKVLNAFQIPYVVIYDEALFRRNSSLGEVNMTVTNTTTLGANLKKISASKLSVIESLLRPIWCRTSLKKFLASRRAVLRSLANPMLQWSIFLMARTPYRLLSRTWSERSIKLMAEFLDWDDFPNGLGTAPICRFPGGCVDVASEGLGNPGAAFAKTGLGEHKRRVGVKDEQSTDE